MVARRPTGDQAVFPVALNHHDAGQLAWSVIPAPIDPAIAARATEIGVGVAAALGVVGLLAIEMFVLRDGRVLVNELAPRPHNSFHHTVEACVTSQFEQLVRAVCNLPLGATDIVRPAAIANVLGDAWSAGVLRILPPHSACRGRGCISTGNAIPGPPGRWGISPPWRTHPSTRARRYWTRSTAFGAEFSRPPPAAARRIAGRAAGSPRSRAPDPPHRSPATCGA